MGFIVITSDDTLINVDFGDTWDGSKNLYKKGIFKRDHISEVILNNNADNSGFVSVRFDGEEKTWQCCINTDILSKTFPVDSVNGTNIVTLDDLYNELKSLML